MQPLHLCIYVCDVFHLIYQSQNAVTLAWGIALQNFPEGLAVSMPLRREGVPLFTAFMYGQLSGMVEPIAGVLGCYLVQYCEPLLPYALAFAAGTVREEARREDSCLSFFVCRIRFVIFLSPLY